MPEPKVVITGTGRAGTTLLVSVLTQLGLDTGEASGKLSGVDSRTHGGLESLLDAPDAPDIVKDTTLPFRLAQLLEAGTVAVSHVIVPIRSLDLAAASRVRGSNYGRNIFARGGLWGTVDPMKQRDALAAMLYELMYTIAKFELPHTLLDFPRFTTDWQYTHRALGFLAPERTPEDFRAALAAVVQADLIHEEPLRPRERLLARRRAVQLKLSADKPSAEKGERGR